MPQNYEENDESTSQNMVSNLPLLFAGGYPTSLAKITEKQLEHFIPFMVQCSLGYVQIDYSEPEWWPEDLAFTNPFSKPKNFKEEWLAKMKEIVIICYSFHKSIFLLRFCDELSTYEPECLRFINNYNSTTSLFDRVSNKLLVTFRNENMLYDQQINHRKCLLPKLSSSQSIDNSQQMVEPVLFDIYLCDNCDAELYSFSAYKEHEKSCQLDDVIICEPDPVESPDENHRQLSAFLLNFSLQSNIPVQNNQILSKETPGSPEKGRRFPRRARGVVALSRCPTIQITSPLGQFLLKKSKSLTNEDYVSERFDRVERFCYAPPLKSNTSRPRWLEKKFAYSVPSISYKKLPEHLDLSNCHVYKFPRRQFSTKSRRKNFMFLNSILLKSCKPCSISVKKLSDSDVKSFIMKVKLKNTNVPETSRKNIKDCKIVEYIDLCSSDDDDDDDNNDDNDNDNSNNKSNEVVEPEITNSNQQQQNSDDNTPNTIQNHISKPLRPVLLFSNVNNNVNNTTIKNTTFCLSTQQNQENHSIKNWLNDTSKDNLSPLKLQTNTITIKLSNTNARRSLTANL